MPVGIFNTDTSMWFCCLLSEPKRLSGTDNSTWTANPSFAVRYYEPVDAEADLEYLRKFFTHIEIAVIC